jgi:hypothetical protein
MILLKKLFDRRPDGFLVALCIETDLAGGAKIIPRQKILSARDRLQNNFLPRLRENIFRGGCGIVRGSPWRNFFGA